MPVPGCLSTPLNVHRTIDLSSQWDERSRYTVPGVFLGERAAFQVWRMYMREPVEGCDTEWAKPGGMSVAEVLKWC